MQGLASFDRWIARRAASLPARNIAPAPQSTPTASSSAHLISPRGDAVIAVAGNASPAALLRAAHGIGAQDWWGVLADDARHRQSLSQGWRLALWRAGGTPQWISSDITARPGHSPAALHQAALAQAVQELWAQGWRLVHLHPSRREA